MCEFFFSAIVACKIKAKNSLNQSILSDLFVRTEKSIRALEIFRVQKLILNATS